MSSYSSNKNSSSSSSQRWLVRNRSDVYVRKAKEEGFRSRAAYKLIEIQHKYKIFKKGMAVVDLGAAPGSWSQLVKKWVSDVGFVLAVDLLPIEVVPGVDIINGDFTELTTLNKILSKVVIESNDKKVVDVILSDMSPNISGVSSVDIPKSLYLAELSFDLVNKILVNNGSFIVKLFQGSGFIEYVNIVKSVFVNVILFKPKSSRLKSKEVYLVAKGFKQDKKINNECC